MIIYAINIPLIFPAGISVNDSIDGNNLILMQNGAGEYILPGTSIAGIFRHKWSEDNKNNQQDEDSEEDNVSLIFGNAAEEDTITNSPLYVPDAVLDIGRGEIKTYTYHRRNRHTGAVLDKSVFSIETAPPGTSTRLTLWLTAKDNDSIYKNFILWLKSIFKIGVIFGGNSNRGVGLAELSGCIKEKSYDLSDMEKHIEYLQDRKRTSEGMNLEIECNMNDCIHEEVSSPATPDHSDNIFSADITFRIPRGQDILISEPAEGDIKDVPMRVTAADGNDYWRLPGSTLHGLFRDWATRLTARDGKNIADSIDNYNLFKGTDNYTSERISNLFISDADKKMSSDKIVEFVKQYPVDDLFGSTLKAGRIHITDSFAQLSDYSLSIEELKALNIKNEDSNTANNEYSDTSITISGNGLSSEQLSKIPDSEVQKRNHVAINSFSGGNYQHSLFSNLVLINGKDNTPQWKTKIIIDNVTDEDIEWLAKSLRALDIGLLRVGSSKSSGRLEVAEPSIQVSDRYHTLFFNNFKPSIEECNNDYKQ